MLEVVFWVFFFDVSINIILQNFGFGFYDGVVGFVKKLFDGVKKDGVGGFLKGVGQGIMGFVVKFGSGNFFFFDGKSCDVLIIVDLF